MVHSKEKEADDPWDEDEERRIFVGKGIFVEGYDDDISKKLEVWSKLPEALREEILVEMERLDIEGVDSYDKTASLSVNPGLNDLDDPIAYMVSCAELLSHIKNAVESGDTVSEQTGEGTPQVIAKGPTRTLTCAYCTSLFILSEGSNTCPNCGAPAQ